MVFPPGASVASEHDALQGKRFSTSGVHKIRILNKTKNDPMIQVFFRQQLHTGKLFQNVNRKKS